MEVILKNKIAAQRKRQRIKISTMESFKDALRDEEYKIDEYDDEKFKDQIKEIFKINDLVISRMDKAFYEEDITYRVNNVAEFIDYIQKIILIEDEHRRLNEEIKNIKTLTIERVEYERIMTTKDNVDDIIKEITALQNNIAEKISEEDKIRLTRLEDEVHHNYVYAKDIELLKKMITDGNSHLEETYNEETKIKTISIKIPEKINDSYIKAKKGSVEYYEHLTNNIPRIERLIKNMHKYLINDQEDKNNFIINHSEVLQDSINMAVAVFQNKEFKAISGSDEIEGYCKTPSADEAAFKSSKVNKLGELGIGYDRKNDSEKKIFEKIHQEIEAEVLNDFGDIILYSKWEPCPSCYSVINQFMKKHPSIKIQVRYLKKYGEI